MEFFINYGPERAILSKLMLFGEDPRILLLEAPYGYGKTKLIFQCSEEKPEGVKCFQMDLSISGLYLDDVFYRLGEFMGKDRMPCLFQALEATSKSVKVEVKGASVIGYRSAFNLCVQPEVENPEDRARRMAVLTHAWFEDMKDYPERVVFIFDGYDEGLSPVLKNWFQGYLLPRVKSLANVRMVIAGEASSSSARACNGGWQLVRLKGIWDASFWLPVLQELRITLPDPSFLKGVCFAHQGSPDQIMRAIERMGEHL